MRIEKIEYLTREDLLHIRGEIDMVMDQIEMTNQRIDNISQGLQLVVLKLEALMREQVKEETK